LAADMMRPARQRIARSLLVALALALGVPATATTSPAREAHGLFARVEGSGSPTIILESGLGDTLDVWRHVQPAIASHCARTFSYNRAGYAGSVPAKGARDAATVVSELRTELQRRGILPPYVLVGHSLGGLYMQYFARKHPNEVQGLVLVDSTHWQQALPGSPKSTGAYGMGRSVVLFIPLIARREFADSARAGEDVHASPPAGDVPTIVLSRTRDPQSGSPESRSEARRLQDEIAADFPAADHQFVADSGHYIQYDRPDVVISSVRKVAGCTPRG
jgi:pimeloyl-ACP methyl ester carboxylesterase